MRVGMILGVALALGACSSDAAKATFEWGDDDSYYSDTNQRADVGGGSDLMGKDISGDALPDGSVDDSLFNDTGYDLPDGPATDLLEEIGPWDVVDGGDISDDLDSQDGGDLDVLLPDADLLPQCPGALYCPCASDEECDSGLCALTPDGAACTGPCQGGECAPGWYCDSQIGGSGVVNSQCIPFSANLCRPCVDDSACVVEQPGMTSFCVSFGMQGSFCLAECSQDSQCPEGYACVVGMNPSQPGGKACAPSGGQCSCGDRFVSDGAWTDCTVEAGEVSCAGISSCTQQGLTDCIPTGQEPELCNGLDDNCNGLVDEGFQDWDADGMADCIDPDDDNDGSPDDEDCDPLEPKAKPGGVETCDGVDNDCDGTVDEADAFGCDTYYSDGDNDGFGGTSACLCAPSSAFPITKGGDCDDSNGAVNPNAQERCDTAGDDNCDGKANNADSQGCTTYWFDGDTDGFASNSATSKCLCKSGDEPGFTATKKGDCNDANSGINPNATELCTGGDEDCDGKINEEGASGCNEYYYDGDNDGFGDATVPTRCLCQSGDQPGYTGIVAGDCNDSNPIAYPGAPDAPETGTTFVDSNCDGIDGDEAASVFVSAAEGSDSNSCGTKSVPCKTIGTGLTRAKALGFSNVLITVGTYAESFPVADGISLYGAYGLDWSRDAAGVTRIEASDVTGIIAEAIVLPTTLNHLYIQGKSGSGLSTRTSVAFRASGCGDKLQLIRVTVQAGDGFKGSNGGSGSNGQGGATGNNGNGTNGGTGGVVQCGSTVPTTGAGGDGGGSYNCGSNNGKPGTGTAMVPGGAGGKAGTNECGDCNDWGGPGSSGNGGATGVNGESAKGCDSPFGTLSGLVWSPGLAPAGTSGALGGGGGGGGGGGTDVDPLSCVIGAGICIGAGGGGGGGGGCGGTAGSPGLSGGASVAILLVNSPIQIKDSLVLLGKGGDGGNGGKGGSGGAGGQGGNPGKPTCDEGGPGGTGGKGGNGGAAGGSGGGCGGPAVGVGYLGAAPNIKNVTYQGGAGGEGGAGGAHGLSNQPPAADGSDGGVANEHAW